MATKLVISPMTRIEGHLDVEVTVETVGAVQQVIEARCAGMNFRGFESILLGRDPNDAVALTQRVCGVCPISHAMASSTALEAAMRMQPTNNGRIIRNLVLGANFVQSHILHTYHLAAPDYISLAGTAADISPWNPQFRPDDLIAGEIAKTLLGHYLRALDMRRKAHRMGALFSGRMPGTATFMPSGSICPVTADRITQFRAVLTELRAFINEVMIPDVQAIGAAFPRYATIGAGCRNLLAYGVFDLDGAGATKLLKRGRITAGTAGTVDVARIREYVSKSWYTSACGNLNPSTGATVPQATKTTGYSWLKAPRYDQAVYEVGPLARMTVNGDYRGGVSVVDRLVARALEARKVADAMDGWLNQLVVGGATYVYKAIPATASGIGLTEAPRGALGHWVQIASGKLSRYQIVSPTTWNASPRDDANRPGAMEQALVGTPVKNIAAPIEVLRVVHSFDPCLSCSVHMVRPDRRHRPEVVLTA